MNYKTKLLTTSLMLSFSCSREMPQESYSGIYSAFAYVLEIEPINQRKNRAINGVKPDWSCGPSSLAMILKYFGKVNDAANTVPLIYNDIMINGQAYYGNAMKVGEKYGLKPELQTNMDKFLNNSVFTDLFKNNKLVYLSTHNWKPGMVGHLVVAHGISSAGIHIADPWAGLKTVMPMDRLRTFSKDKYAVVFHDPSVKTAPTFTPKLISEIEESQEVWENTASPVEENVDVGNQEESASSETPQSNTDVIQPSTPIEAVSENSNECNIKAFTCSFGGYCNLRSAPGLTGPLVGGISQANGSFAACEIKRVGGTYNTWVRIKTTNTNGQTLTVGSEFVWVYANETYYSHVP